jgi:hypothetical protein
MVLIILYILLGLSFLGFFLQSARRNGHGMVYAAILFTIWAAIIYWYQGGFTLG